MRTLLRTTCATLALLAAACVGGSAGTGITAEASAASAVSPPSGYKKVSELVKLPEFLPGLGTLYVQPATLPAGPFLAYDRDGKLVSTIYMIPLEDMQAQKSRRARGRTCRRSSRSRCTTMPATPGWRSRTNTSSSGTYAEDQAS